jgi:hypothetical protein
VYPKEEMIDKMKHLYNLMDKPLPEVILEVDSPMALQLTLNSFKDNSQLRSQLYSQLRSQLRLQLDLQLNSQLRSQLDSQLDSQLNSQLYSQLQLQLSSQLGSQLDSQRLKYYNHINLSYYWGGYYCFYDYIINELLHDVLDKKTKGLFALMKDFIFNSNYVYFGESIIVYCKKPTKVLFNSKGELHCSYAAAVEYPDGYKIYCKNGEAVDKYMCTPLADIIEGA